MGTRPALRSGQNAFNDVAVDVGQAEMASLKAVGELFVVDPELMHHSGLKVVDVDLVLGRVPESAMRTRYGGENIQALGLAGRSP